jgi:hypothetical protein
MIPLILGVSAAALLIHLFEEDSNTNSKGKRRIFISFAREDSKYRTFLVSQAKLGNSPFSFIDMSVKKAWEERLWKQKCRTKIKSCDGMIVLLSKNTWHASGLRWEIKCAREERIPIVGMHIDKKDIGAIPPELKGKRIINWTWNNLADVIDKI